MTIIPFPALAPAHRPTISYGDIVLRREDKNCRRFRRIPQNNLSHNETLIVIINAAKDVNFPLRCNELVCIKHIYWLEIEDFCGLASLRLRLKVHRCVADINSQVKSIFI